MSKKLDIFAVTETWSRDRNEPFTAIKEIRNILKDFKAFELPREGRRGGGIAFFYRNNFNVTENSNHNFKSFEHTDLCVTYNNFSARFVTVYRPPPSKINKLTNGMFFEEFSSMLELLNNCQRPLLLCGDFNFHVDDDSDREALKFIDHLDSSNLVQRVNEPTHRKGHTLDLIITRSESNLIRDTRVIPDIYSDHRVVTCKINCSKPPRSKILVSYRPTKELNPREIKMGLTQLLVSDRIHKQDLNSLVVHYNTSLKYVYDTHLPLKTRWVTQRHGASWYTDELREAKRNKRRFERIYRKSRLEIHQQLFASS